MASTKLRPLYLVEILKKYTDDEHRLSADELCALVRDDYGVDYERKALYRDIAALIDSGLDIDIVKSTRGYYMRDRKISLEDARRVCVAVKTAPFFTVERTSALIEKLSDGLSRSQSELLKGQSNVIGAKSDDVREYDKIDEINLAIKAKRKISFSHSGTENDCGLRTIASPFAVVIVGAKSYLLCNVDDTDDISLFRIDQINGIITERISAQFFREFIDSDDFYAIAVSILTGSYRANIRRIVISCTQESDDVLERFSGKILLKKRTETGYTLTVETAATDSFFSWAVMNSVTIISPDDVKSEYIRRIERILDLHK